MFLLVWQGRWRDFIMPVNKVQLIYVNQNIPSPFGMPAFELNPIPTSLIVGSHDTIHDALSAYEASIESTVPPAAVDFLGERVRAYIRHTRIANELIIQKMIISLDKVYSFAPSVLLI
jgi:hypothetical protein